ncbi:MAG: 6-phosphofructokinase [Candidatus Levybacteria bacterium RIFCSPHIGHO2_01_FULL_41_15]|nr:MAG: 6-phosphofructokinase [Candidatus Levybacteria bacterium RIFCSPHIGHO2_01_FULL_41_15]OGW86205.1 MAG: 6-phosphofructokinase [Omnitrophica bacterium RIFCSPLOWO2_01_FULL_45_10b]
MKRIGLLTSGGDAPGMNAAIRSVVRMGYHLGIKTYGVMRGYQGLLSGGFKELGPRDVSNIIHRGGTILKTSRCAEFKTNSGLKKAKLNLDKKLLDGLIVIGGDGTYRGAYELSKVWSGQIIGVPGTIDNDLYGTDFTIGYDTAVNTALQAIDKIRDTAESHERMFLVEVMGREAGFIALDVGISGGAEDVLLPEIKTNLKSISKHLYQAREAGKTSSIIIVAEGDEEGGAFQIAEKLKQLSGNEYHVVVLGHLQRGGTPTSSDRKLATELGAFALLQMIEGKNKVAVGRLRGVLSTTLLSQTWKRKKPLDPFLLKLLPILAK